MVLLPEEAEMTLAELRQMASRQQQQIEAHHQLLLTKEQRLKFLKQQESRYHHLTDLKVDPKSLQSLRERVDAQEMKLRQLKALHGQVDQQKSNNSNLTNELESIRALFNEKEKELSIAVSKVEELTQQLDDIRSNKNQRQPLVSPLVAQLENMKRELMFRNKKTDEQNQQISQQRALISQRQKDIVELDMKIAELTQRLQKKQLLNQQLANQIHNASISRHPIHSPNIYHHSNVATVEPMQREPQEHEHTRDDLSAKLRGAHEGDLSEFSLKKNDPKYQTLPYNTKFILKVNPNDGDGTLTQAEDALSTSSSSTDNSLERNANHPTPAKSVQNFSPRPFASQHNANNYASVAQVFGYPVDTNRNHDSSVPNESSQPPVKTTVNEKGNKPEEKLDSVDGNVTCRIQNNTDLMKKPKVISETPSVSARIQKDKTFSSKTSSAKPVVPPKPTLPVKPIPPPRQTPTKDRSQSDDRGNVVSMALSYLQNKSSAADKKSIGNYRERLLYYRCIPSYSSQNTVTSKQSNEPKVGTYFTKSSSLSDIKSQDAVRRKPIVTQLPIKPKPLTIRKTPGIEPPKLKVPQNYSNGAYKKASESSKVAQGSDASLTKDEKSIDVPKPSIAINNQLSAISAAIKNGNYEDSEPFDSLESEKAEDDDLKKQERNVLDFEDDDSSSPCDSLECVPIENGSNLLKIPVVVAEKESLHLRSVKGSLKTDRSTRIPRRVSFDPLALLLDAALEGELELVKKTAYEVPNPSAGNDEGITALHNAICAGHYEVVTFLVDFGCDVNAPDSDGWTPLHCAASCNNLPMVKFLVERGACIFATTLSDHETAAEKCEEKEEGFDGCSEYLYGLQENMGLVNDGTVYAVYDYNGLNSDELALRDGDIVTILRNGDDQEKEWWWSKLNDEEGYVPRNLLGLFPRVQVKKD